MPSREKLFKYVCLKKVKIKCFMFLSKKNLMENFLTTVWLVLAKENLATLGNAASCVQYWHYADRDVWYMCIKPVFGSFEN